MTVSFLVVGSPRSGTTLLQRLACEIPGVSMPPETHFFSQFATGLLERRSFPLGGEALAEEIGRFATADSSRGLVVDPEAVVKDLGGTCPGPYALFDALVRHLAGPGPIYGEKTPEHVLWWRPLARAAPELRFVATVRDPRAVVASNLAMPWRHGERMPAWGDNVHLAFAELWRRVQREVAALAATLGPPRVLVVRYEDVVADPDAHRAALAAFLGLPPVQEPVTAPPGIVLPSEPWKRDALGPVTGDRRRAFEGELAERRAAQVAALCREGMRRFGYGDEAPSSVAAARLLLETGPRQWLRSWRYRRAYDGYLAAIDSRTL